MPEKSSSKNAWRNLRRRPWEKFERIDEGISKEFSGGIAGAILEGNFREIPYWKLKDIVKDNFEERPKKSLKAFLW